MKIDYIMMDETNLVCRCLHDGTIPVEDANSVVKGMNQNSIEDFLKIICNMYGSCAVLAKYKGNIIGFIRFYPRDILERYESFDALCIQWWEKCVIKPGFDMEFFPKKNNLAKKDLTIQYFQVGSKHHRNWDGITFNGQGIAKKCLKLSLLGQKNMIGTKLQQMR